MLLSNACSLYFRMPRTMKWLIIPDNEPPQGQYVSTVQIENYIQRCFIDLLGREALD